MAARTQDLPPPGGYSAIPWKRVPAKSYFKWKTMWAIHFAVSSGALYLYYLNYKKVERDNIEMRSAKFAIMPLLFAERDREYLKQIRRNRDEEAKLMANVPGWEVGTWYGEPVFKTLPKDTFVDPSFREYYGHTTYKETAKRAHLKFWH